MEPHSRAITTVLATMMPDNLPSGPALQVERYQVSHGMPQVARFLQAGDHLRHRPKRRTAWSAGAPLAKSDQHA
jgi:hypothetical protein